MDYNQPNIQYCQCIVCGSGCSIVANGDDASTRVENTRLFSIFVRCVSSNNDEIDSSIVSELDSAVNSCNDDVLVFCSMCKNALIKWDILYENLCVVIAQKLNRIKFMLYVKILNNSVPDKIDTHAGNNTAEHGEVNDGHQSLLFVKKIQHVKDQICRQFSPRVTLNRIPDRTDSGTESNNLVNSFDEDEFETFNEVQDQNDAGDGDIDNSVPSDNPLSVEDETNDGTVENKCRKKPFVRPNTVSKPIGPGKFLYRDKYVFFQKNTKFECAECSAVIGQKSHMVRHMRLKHMKDEEFSPKVALNRIPDRTDSGTESKNLVNGCDEDESEAFSEIFNDNYDDDLFEQSEYNNDNLVSTNADPNVGGESNCRRKPFTFPKLIGPGKFLYRDKYIFFRKNNKFECAECSASITRRNHMLGHIRAKHMNEVGDVKELNYLGYHLTADENGFFCCPVCHCRRKRAHIYKHIRELRKKQQSRTKPSIASFKTEADLTSEYENIIVMPLNAKADQDPVAATAVFETENNLENIETFSSATGDPNFVNEVLPRRSLRERRPTAVAVDPVDMDDEASSDQEQDRANAGHDDDWEMASEVSMNENEFDAFNETIDNDTTDGTESKRGRKPFIPPNSVSKLVGPGKFVYLDKFVFFQKNNNFECAECLAVVTRRNTMLRHIRLKHMKDDDLRGENQRCRGRTCTVSKPVGPRKFMLGDKNMYFQKNNKFECAQCSTIIKRRDHMLRHIRRKHIMTCEGTKPVSDGSEFEESASENLVNSVEEVRFGALSDTLNENDDELVEDSKTQKDQLSVDDEPNDGTGDKRGRKPFVRPNTVSKLIGPGKFLYRDKLLFFQKNNMFECGECSAVRTQRRHMVRHMGRKHMKEEGKSNRKINMDMHELVSSGPDEWIYADKYKIIFNSEEERYYCGLCCAAHSERAGLVTHIKDQHIDGKFTKRIALRQAGPNEYVYRDTGYKVNVDNNNDWYCVECGAQRKNRVSMATHIRESHINQGKRPKSFRTSEEVAPNEFLYNGKYSFRFDPDQKLYLCSLCDYTSALVQGVTTHIRFNHYTDAEKQELTAVEVIPGEYLYGGRYKILFENGSFRCTLCNITREALHKLYPHFRVVHPEGSGEGSQSLTAPRGENGAAKKSKNPPDADKNPSAPVAETKKERIRQLMERRSVRVAIWKGWKIQGNGKWAYKNNWQVIVQDGKYKCLTCDVEEADRKTAFKHVQIVHAEERSAVRPSVAVRLDEITELEYEGFTYKYDPFENKYTCGVCNAKSGERKRMIRHIKDKHIDPQRFICDICGQRYDTRLHLRYHRARHEGPKYACKHCDKRFTSESYLTTHLRIHMGEDAKKHQCEFCGKKFYDVKQLKNHRPIHTGEKPFPCDLCGESFPSTFKRREHRKKVHGGLPQKHGWKPTEGDVVVQPVYSATEDLTASEIETETLGSFAGPTDGEPA